MSLDALLDPSWARSFVRCCNEDMELRAIGGRSRFCFLWEAFGRRSVIEFLDGTVRVVPAAGPQTSWEFSLVAPDETWMAWLAPVPPPGHHDLMALWLTDSGLRVDGDRKCFAQHLRVTRRLFELGRMTWREAEAERRPRTKESSNTTLDSPVLGTVEPITGRYLTLDVMDKRYRVYFEEAGSGPPVLLLHTAAADSRQYRHVLNDTEYHRNRLIAVDLPYHGRSLPPDGWWNRPYRLTQEFYATFVERFCDVLELERPVLVGASMAAQIVLELVVRRPERYRAVVGFGAVDHVGGDPAPWLHHPEVNESEVVPGWIVGMVGPGTPEWRRREIWWCYSQSAAGVFVGDGSFFMSEWDGRERLGGLDTGSCSVHLFAGEYDYSRPPARVRATAELIGGATFTELRGCGHFPMIEDPDQVKSHLLPILETAG